MTEQQNTEPDVDETTEVEESTEPTDESTTEEPTEEVEQTEEEADTFPRSVVEKLRKENAGYREKAKKAETYAKELFSTRVAATGRLADPTDLSFDESLLDDHDALTAAVEELVARKPHLALRKPRGDVGAGALSSDGASVDLAGILRSRA